MRDDLMKAKKELEELKEESFALSLLKDYKKQAKRQFIVLIVVIISWLLTIGYFVYVLNDVGTSEETITQENADGYNNYIGNDGDITNGEASN